MTHNNINICKPENSPSLLQQSVFWLRFCMVLIWGLLCSICFALPAIFLWGNISMSWAYARTLSWVGLKILGVKVVISGVENLKQRPAIVIANHQSNYDIVLLGQIYPRHTVVIGKIDRSDRKEAINGLGKAVDALQTKNKNIWIFPEGKRSRGKGFGTFKMGAFHMAIAVGVPLIPIVGSSTDCVINARRRYAPGGVYHIHVLPPVATQGLLPEDAEMLRDRLHQICLNEWETLSA